MDDFTSPPAPVRAVAAERSTPASLARIGLLGLAAAALLAVAILAFGSSVSPASTLAAGSDPASNTIVENLNGMGDHRGFGMGGITITAISGSNISLTTADGWTRTITVDSGTTFTKSGASIKLSDLKVGDEIGFRQTHEANGSWTIDSITVVLPRAGGEVTAVSGSTITVKDRDGATVTIKVSDSTTYTVAGASAKLSDIKVGMFLVAEGTKNSDGSLSATTVRAGDHDGFGGRGFGHGPDGDHDQNTTGATSAPSTTGTAG